MGPPCIGSVAADNLGPAPETAPGAYGTGSGGRSSSRWGRLSCVEGFVEAFDARGQGQFLAVVVNFLLDEGRRGVTDEQGEAGRGVRGLDEARFGVPVPVEKVQEDDVVGCDGRDSERCHVVLAGGDWCDPDNGRTGLVRGGRGLGVIALPVSSARSARNAPASSVSGLGCLLSHQSSSCWYPNGYGLPFQPRLER